MDTTKIELSTSLSDLMERLAENVHNVWARQRLSEGWQPGPERNDTAREHPGLVPYEELSEVEKQYDRETATETLKMILALGYRIEPPPEKGD